jgi:nitroreductase/NAD-dependent dihydropyrimidine dehydrogenase PreA subunit
MAHLEIDLSLCNKDGLCISECPAFLLTRGKDKFPVPAADAADRCILCGHCIAVCPTGALSLAGQHAAELTQLDHALDVSPEAAAQFMRSRRSVRRFRDKPVERALVRQCIDIARYAPSGVNTQPVNWIVVDDPDLMVALVDLTAKSLRRLPYFMPYLDAWARGEDLILRNAPQLVVAHAPKGGLDNTTNCVVALAHFDLAAHALGLGTCWAGLFTHAAGRSKSISAALCIPETHKIYGALMLGRPKHGFKRLPERKRPPVRFL